MDKNDNMISELIDTFPGPSKNLLSSPPIASRTKIRPNIVLWNDNFSAHVVYRLEELMVLLMRIEQVHGILLHKGVLDDDGRSISFITMRAFLLIPQQGVSSVHIPASSDWSTLKRVSERVRAVFGSNVDLPTRAASPNYFLDDSGRKVVIAYGNDSTVEYALKLQREQRPVDHLNAVNDADVIEAIDALVREIDGNE